jgi:hypothetical protein
MLELQNLVENIMALPLDKKAYLAEILLRDIDRKTASAKISGKRTFGEYIGKIEMTDDFSDPLPDEFWLGEYDETAS